MKKLTNFEILTLKQQFEQFEFNCRQEKLVLPGNVSYAMHKNATRVFTLFHKQEKFRFELIEKYGKKDKDGKPIYLKDKNRYEMTDEKAFNKEYEALMKNGAEIDFHYISNVKEVIDSITGNHGTLQMLWSLIDIINDTGAQVLDSNNKKKEKIEKDEKAPKKDDLVVAH